MKIIKTIAPVLLLIQLSCMRMENANLQKGQPKQEGIVDKKKILLTDVSFDKVIAYDFAGNTGISLLDSNNKLTKTVKKAIVLNNQQFKELMQILVDTSTFGGYEPLDFYPHFGVAFYKNQKIIHYFEISLMCNGIWGSVEIPGLMSREYPDAGFSENGRENIYAFCKKLGFKESPYLDKKEWCCK